MVGLGFTICNQQTYRQGFGAQSPLGHCFCMQLWLQLFRFGQLSIKSRFMKCQKMLGENLLFLKYNFLIGTSTHYIFKLKLKFLNWRQSLGVGAPKFGKGAYEFEIGAHKFGIWSRRSLEYGRRSLE